MIYSSFDMLEAIKSKDLIVDPFHPNNIRPVGLALHLGEDLLIPEDNEVIDIKNKVLPKYNLVKIALNQPYTLKPHAFALAHTYEKITLSTRLAMMIEGRSTIARLGLTVVQTAMLVDPGHTNRVITLELANHSKNPILLYPKMKIARAIICELKTPAHEPYDKVGKYRNQTTAGQPIFEDEFLD